MEWRDVTDTFSERERHYKNLYLEECQVLGDDIEVSLFAADDPADDCEVYFTYCNLFGIVYATIDDARDEFESIRSEFEEEHSMNGKPSPKFIDAFFKRHDVAIPDDIFFDVNMDSLFGL